jgi:hypothetical protein
MFLVDWPHQEPGPARSKVYRAIGAFNSRRTMPCRSSSGFRTIRRRRSMPDWTAFIFGALVIVTMVALWRSR